MLLSLLNLPEIMFHKKLLISAVIEQRVMNLTKSKLWNQRMRNDYYQCTHAVLLNVLKLAILVQLCKYTKKANDYTLKQWICNSFPIFIILLLTFFSSSHLGDKSRYILFHISQEIFISECSLCIIMRNISID